MEKNLEDILSLSKKELTENEKSLIRDVWERCHNLYKQHLNKELELGVYNIRQKNHINLIHDILGLYDDYKIEPKSETVFIYTLSDPRNNQIRYVGKSVNLEARLKGHLSTSRHAERNSNKGKWIMSLYDENLEPVIEAIDEVPADEWEYWEHFWIQTFLVWGCDLTNYGCHGNSYVWKKRHIKQHNERVLQYDREGNFIAKHENASEASDHYRISKGKYLTCDCIKACCAGRSKTSGGYVWKYEEI
jgi:hypothetical protein